MIERVAGSGLHSIKLDLGETSHYFITVRPQGGKESPDAWFARAVSPVQSLNASILGQDLFGTITANSSVPTVEPEWPVTRLRGTGNGNGLAGTQLQAVTGAGVRPIRLEGRTVGYVYDDGHSRCCRLGDVRAADTSLSREKQAQAVFESIERALEAAGLSFTDLVRTWFYLDDILAWYGDFNRVRTGFFAARRVFDRLVPASTGIGGGNAAGAALVANALAVRPLDRSIRKSAVASPLQCPALRYGSSFSRAVEISGSGWRQLLVSGTAAIHPDGKSAHPGNFEKQALLTLDVVKAILESRRMAWRDVTRAITYLKNGEDAPAFERMLANLNFPDLPMLVIENTICRDDLLFEIEVDAAAPGK
ncbi:MAG TPA: Rid family hydrolase [bacterium]|nr:Rid family hydrolase [bacterium]HNS48499.1 Rid family hydrolase [bacterium]